jgi:outer membrane receptor protein involved in Fe transport
MRVRVLPPSLLLAGFLLSLAVVAAAGDLDDCELEGVVVDHSGLPVPGVTVTLHRPDGREPLAAPTGLTGDDGRFALCAVPGGGFEVHASLDGFRQRERLVIPPDPRPRSMRIVLAPAVTEEVVVTATRTRVAVSDVPIRTEVVPTRLIEHLTPRTLADTLAFTPGVRVENNCQSCNFTQVHLLGLDGAYTQFLLDGLPVVSSLAQVYGVEQIPARMIERVEIVKGGGSALYAQHVTRGARARGPEPARADLGESVSRHPPTSGSSTRATGTRARSSRMPGCSGAAGSCSPGCASTSTRHSPRPACHPALRSCGRRGRRSPYAPARRPASALPRCSTKTCTSTPSTARAS